MNLVYLRSSILLATSAGALAALAAGSNTSAASFNDCVVAQVAENPGKLTAEAKARKVCREQFPMTADEMEALRSRISTKPETGAGSTATTPTSTTSAGASGATATTTTTTSSTPAVSSTPAAVTPPVASVPALPAAAAHAHGGSPK